MEGSDEQRQFEHPPRPDSALQPLSQEHACALARAQTLLIAATPDDRLAALRGFIHAWEHELAPHFEDEERFVLPLIPHCECRRRVLAEHEELRRMASAAMLLGPDPDPEWLRRLGQLLHDHIRWEERELFPALEHDLSTDARTRLAENLRRAKSARGPQS